MVKKRTIGNYVYYESDLIAQGGFSKIYRGEAKNNPQQIVAIKMIDIQQFPQYDFQNEFQLHYELAKCPSKYRQFITNILDSFYENNRFFYIVMEFCNNGNLNEINTSDYHISTKLYYFYQIIQGMKLLNENNIIHRDLKLENILIKNNKAKLADFGLSKKIPQDLDVIYLDRVSGSEGYMAPEIQKYLNNRQMSNNCCNTNNDVEQRSESKNNEAQQNENKLNNQYNQQSLIPYSKKCDIYSLGVILFQFLFGVFPPRKEIQSSFLVEQIQYGLLWFKQEDRRDLVEFIKAMIEVDPDKRASLQELVSLPFYKFLQENYQKISKRSQNKFQSLASADIISHQEFSKEKSLLQQQLNLPIKHLFNNPNVNLAFKSTILASAVSFLLLKCFNTTKK